jgi:hypothetical protein
MRQSAAAASRQRSNAVPGHQIHGPPGHRTGTMNHPVEARTNAFAVTFADCMPAAENL